MKLKMLLSALAIGFVLILAVPAQKRDATSRSVQGVVTDSSGSPVQGAVVQLKDTKSLQIRSFYSEKDGSYHFAGLSTNIDYELKADHAGSSTGTKTLSSFDTHPVATVNLKLK